MSPRRLGSRTALLALAGLAALLIAGPASASAAGGWWVLTATAAPTNLQPGQPAVVNFKASNTGYGTIVGSKEHPIVLRATLPAGFEATKSLEGFAGPENNAPVVKRERHKLACKVEGRTVTCPWEGSIPPTESIRMKAAGVMNAATPVGTTEQVIEVSGGDAVAPEPYVKKLQITPEATPFGVMRYELRPENEKGEPETQAGAHPFQLTSIFDLNEKVVEVAPTIGEAQEFPTTTALPKNLHFVLPPGLIGKAAGVPRCNATSFAALQEGGSNKCEQNTHDRLRGRLVLQPGRAGLCRRGRAGLQPRTGRRRTGPLRVRVPHRARRADHKSAERQRLRRGSLACTRPRSPRPS